MERGEQPLTTVHLVRHAAHGLLGRVLTGRMEGVGLSEAGRAQAARLAETLGARKLGAIVSSPLQRARETAEPIAARAGLSVTIDAGLDEIDFGEWTGLTFAELDRRPEWLAWNSARGLAACPGGETMLAAQSRAVSALHRLAATHPDGELVLVSHQDVLKSLLAHLLGSPLDLLHRFALDPGHVSTVTLSSGEALVGSVNLSSDPATTLG